jgi:hypothetical protein
MISADLLSILAWLAAVIAFVYAIMKAAPTDADTDRSARYAAYLGALLVVVALGLNAYADRTDSPPTPLPPAPGPPTPGPTPPGPQPPAPVTFASRIQAAAKADGMTPGLAHALGGMAVTLSQAIIQQPATFTDAAHIGATWETYRGKVFQPMGKWCPKTTETLATEIESRGLHTGPITDPVLHAKLWQEFGQALQASE